MSRSVLDCFAVAEHIGPNGSKALDRLVELQADISAAVHTGELTVSAQATLEDRVLQLAEDIACELRSPEIPPAAIPPVAETSPVIPPVAETSVDADLLNELGVDATEGQ